MQRKRLILQLFELGAIQFGAFTLKSKIISPIYLDLRLTISQPDLLIEIAQMLRETVQSSYDLICGVPYTALPFATAISIASGTPMVLRRKEKKEYGTKKNIEGIFKPGMQCLIIEDLVTSGSSVLETAMALREEGLQVFHAAALIDREQGGRKNLAANAIELHSVFSIREVLHTLQSEQKIDALTTDSTLQFLQSIQL